MSYILLIASVFTGSILVFILKPKKSIVRLLLAFSGAYLLSVTILHLLPEVYQETKDFKTIGILILFGIIIQSILESFSKGAEHGHIHLHSDNKKFLMLLFISLCIHAFSEGLPIHHSNHNLLWAIVVHKIPIAIILTTFFYKSKMSKVSILTFLFLFALMTPLGSFLSEQLTFLEAYQNEISALVIGIFLHISTTILFESSEGHKFNLTKLIVIVTATVIAFFI